MIGGNEPMPADERATEAAMIAGMGIDGARTPVAAVIAEADGMADDGGENAEIVRRRRAVDLARRKPQAEKLKTKEEDETLERRRAKPEAATHGPPRAQARP